MARTKQTARQSTSSEPTPTEEEQKTLSDLAKRADKLEYRLRAAHFVDEFFEDGKLDELKDVLDSVLKQGYPLPTAALSRSLQDVRELRSELRKEIRERYERQVRTEQVIEASERYEREAASQRSRSRSRSPVRSCEPLRARSPLSFVPRM